MGNWRTVNMLGSCASSEVGALKEACTTKKDYSNFHPLSITASLCGLNDWVDERISAIGNLAERDYSVEDIATTLRELVKAAPSLHLKVHCGGEYEDKACVATVTVESGVVTIGAPEVRELMEIPAGVIHSNILKSLFRV